MTKIAIVLLVVSAEAKLRGVVSKADAKEELEASLARGRALLESDADADCIPRNVEVTECTGAAIIKKVEELSPGCDLLVDREEELDQVCQDAKAAVDSTQTRNFVVEKELISNWDAHDLKTYFDGGGDWNEETDSDDSKLKDQAARVNQVYETVAQGTRIAVPLIYNFQQDDSAEDEDTAPLNCELNAMMCCWSRDRQANDGNGNCAEPYDENCVDADPADNTDICYADASRAPESVHVENGFSWYGENFEEGDTHCHGLAWADDASSDSYRFAGNVLFFVSMYDHMYQRGYVENIPGAPMCSCLEKMPTVSRSDCTQADVQETWKLTFKCASVTGIRRESLTIAFNACDGATANDLYSELEQIYGEGNLSAYEKYLVGPSNNDDGSSCPTDIAEVIAN